MQHSFIERGSRVRAKINDIYVYGDVDQLVDDMVFVIIRHSELPSTYREGTRWPVNYRDVELCPSYWTANLVVSMFLLMVFCAVALVVKELPVELGAASVALALHAVRLYSYVRYR